MSESMRKLINLVESMGDQMPRRDPLVPLNIGDFVKSANTMPAVRSAFSPPLHVIRDRKLIEKAYQLYLKGFEQIAISGVGEPKLTPAQAILQARESFKV